MRVLICGGGVIGAATAYFLSLHQIEAVVIERTGVACAASGKSGGFLALDWCDGTPLAPLARRSFALHAELAGAFGDLWDHRPLDTLSVVASARRAFGGSSPARPGWLGPQALVRQQLGTTRTTAQIHPAKFTAAMIEAAIERGAQLRQGEVTGVARSSDQERVTGVLVDGERVEGDAVVIAMGPWSVLASRWLDLPMIYGLKGHSVVLRPKKPVSPHALFVECEVQDGSTHAPEVFPRPDGTVYVCGLPGEDRLPLDPAAITSTGRAQEQLLAMIRTFAPALADAEVVASQACYRPGTADGLPLVGAVPGARGAYVATGHSVWGMLNAPATGEAMAQLITTGQAGIDLGPFDPARLPSLPADALRV
jgi:glycine/D-amino acid oxidase-like deaminating enzyme